MRRGKRLGVLRRGKGPHGRVMRWKKGEHEKLPVRYLAMSRSLCPQRYQVWLFVNTEKVHYPTKFPQKETSVSLCLTQWELDYRCPIQLSNSLPQAEV